MQNCSLKTLLSHWDYPHPLNYNEIFENNNPVVVEIGFGMGEVLIKKSQENPNINYVGIEENWERIYKTLGVMTRLQEEQKDEKLFSNVKILKIDARIAFERLFDQRSIDQIYCLFPCPWPKKSHVKHRLFSKEFLELLNSRLKEKGTLQIVTDFFPFHKWVLDQNLEDSFSSATQTIQAKYQTKFERKWQEEGQEEFFEVILTKKNHVDQKNQKEVALKAYTIDTFDPETFEFQDQKAEITVILKETLYDPKKEKAMLLLIVSEPHLTQTFWVVIIKKGSKWNVSKAKGQKFYPTPGAAEAVRLVYESALKK